MISAETAKFHAKIMHRQEKTMYTRTQKYRGSKVGSNDSNAAVGQIKDALVYDCPRAEAGWRTGPTADSHYTNSPGLSLLLYSVCNSSVGTSVHVISIPIAANFSFSFPAHTGELKASSPPRAWCNDAFERSSAKVTVSGLFCSSLVGRDRWTFALTPAKSLPSPG